MTIAEAVQPDNGRASGAVTPRLVRNIAALTGSQAVTWLTSIAAMLVVPRALGPARMGTLTAAIGVSSILTLVAGFVTADYLVRAMVVADQGAARLAGTALILRALMTPVFALVLIVYVKAAGISHGAAPVYYLLGAAGMANILLDPLQAGFKAVERMEYVALSNVIVNSSSGLIALAVVLLGGRAVGLAVATATISGLNLLLNGFWARRLQRVTFRRASAGMLRLVLQGLPFWPLQLASLVYLYIDTVVLSLMSDPRVVGWYGVATKLFGTLLFAPTILATAWYPRLISGYQGSADEFRRQVRSFLSLIPALSIPVVAATAVGAGPVIHTIYGAGYSGAVPVMVILGFCAIPMYLGVALGQVLMAAKRPSALTSVLLGGVAVNVSLNVVLIPAFASRYANGALGSAVSLLITELLITLSEVLIARRYLGGIGLLARVPGSLAASGLMVAVAELSPKLGLGSLVIAGTAFVVAAVPLRVITPQERTRATQWLRRSVHLPQPRSSRRNTGLGPAARQTGRS